MTLAESGVPVRMISSRLLLRSNTISAPVRVSESCSAASQMATTAFCHTPRSEGSLRRRLNIPAQLVFWPRRSSARRSSGWNSTTAAIKPICRKLLSTQRTVRSSSR